MAKDDRSSRTVLPSGPARLDEPPSRGAQSLAEAGNDHHGGPAAIGATTSTSRSHPQPSTNRPTRAGPAASFQALGQINSMVASATAIAARRRRLRDKLASWDY